MIGSSPLSSLSVDRRLFGRMIPSWRSKPYFYYTCLIFVLRWMLCEVEYYFFYERCTLSPWLSIKVRFVGFGRLWWWEAAGGAQFTCALKRWHLGPKFSRKEYINKKSNFTNTNTISTRSDRSAADLNHHQACSNPSVTYLCSSSIKSGMASVPVPY